jgi:GDP-L-fucose synthase
MKIFVAGHRGLVGSAIVRQIEIEGKHEWVGKTRTELDLLDRAAVFSYLKQQIPYGDIIDAA